MPFPAFVGHAYSEHWRYVQRSLNNRPTDAGRLRYKIAYAISSGLYPHHNLISQGNNGGSQSNHNRCFMKLAAMPHAAGFDDQRSWLRLAMKPIAFLHQALNKKTSAIIHSIPHCLLGLAPIFNSNTPPLAKSS